MTAFDARDPSRTRTHGDPVPAITEAAATGETATLFADIRATLGVNVVNLVWRHLAAVPGALPWAWATVKPVYASGRVSIEARRIKSGLAMPENPGWPRSLLQCVGIDDAGEASIRRILASYDRANAMNLAALSALLRRIDGVSVEAGIESVAMDGSHEAAVDGLLPRLLALDEVAPDTADLIRRINLLGDRGQGRIIASMYRHVAHWPGFLALGYAHLAPFAADGRLDKMIVQAIALGVSAGARLQTGIKLLPPPDDVMAIRAAAVNFIEHAIGKMVPVVVLLMSSMPKDG